MRSRAARWAALLLVVPVAGCGGGSDERGAGTPKLEHVHGLGLNPADDTLYVATHNGVFTVDDGRAELVADRAQDTMGFAIAGPDRFFASGHPADSGSPNPLGLIESTDRAATWSPKAFSGEADFHAIDVADPWIYAYSADRGALIRSQDTEAWESVASAPMIDIAADPADPDRVVATTNRGELVAYAADADSQVFADAPLLTQVDWTPDGVLVGLGPRGEVRVSGDGGQAWSEGRALRGSPEALSVDASTWYAATTAGIYTSSDLGQSWRQIFTSR